MDFPLTPEDRTRLRKTFRACEDRLEAAKRAAEADVAAVKRAADRELEDVVLETLESLYERHPEARVGQVVRSVVDRLPELVRVEPPQTQQPDRRLVRRPHDHDRARVAQDAKRALVDQGAIQEG